jgi:nitrogenase molybdenum-iron protein alpha/beta subunit
MATLLLNLRNVPDDEAGEVRALLDGHGIDYYETPPSFWGVSAGGLWLRDTARLDEARAHLARYQAERGERMRAARAAELREGRAPGTWAGIRAHPRQAIGAILGILLMLAVATLPFLLIAR